MLNNLKKSGLQLSSQDIHKAESTLGVVFCSGYRDFLLKFNGGVPAESYIDFNSEKLNLPGDEIKRFHGLRRKATNDLRHKMETIGDYLPEGVIYIANTHVGNFFLLSLRDDSYGKIFYKDHDFEDNSPFDPNNGSLPESIDIVANTFDDFLASLCDADE